ncbi:alpha/beta fold hydrolase [Algihabitans albus]|uniref:alpha/beta fold hydrolase n=1 Tax=Algihabitans albus TaxID=2164067 RepID=UPI000E5CE42E|nr:alpha/beta hydrolase [Algihabitans albus]
MEPKESRVQGLSASGFHRIAYRDWGPRDAGRTVVCVHGLTRNGRDFDALAAHLAQAGWRVICPDVVGRGDSDWLGNAAHYGYAQYLQDMTALLARLDVEEVDWIGTSMGGLIGMMLAACRGHPIKRLVVNDVGPLIPKAALERIAEYVGQTWAFADLAEAERHVCKAYGGFGDLTAAQWAKLTRDSLRPGPDGGYLSNYDPGIGAPFVGQPLKDVDLWATWDAISCPVLLLRGAQSDLLSTETAAEMRRRGPPTRLVEIPGAGHAPALLSPFEFAAIRDWLDETAAR